MINLFGLVAFFTRVSRPIRLVSSLYSTTLPRGCFVLVLIKTVSSSFLSSMWALEKYCFVKMASSTFSPTVFPYYVFGQRGEGGLTPNDDICLLFFYLLLLFGPEKPDIRILDTGSFIRRCCCHVVPALWQLIEEVGVTSLHLPPVQHKSGSARWVANTDPDTEQEYFSCQIPIRILFPLGM